MMVKKLIGLILSMALLIVVMPAPSEAAVILPTGVPQSVVVNGKTLNINESIANSKGYVVYGSSSDVTNNELKQGQYRYLGYDINRNPFTNKDFPNDADSGRAPHEKQWIEYPWSKSLRLCTPSVHNLNPKASQWLDSLNWPGWSGSKLVNYLSIQSEPSYAQGSVIGWHRAPDIWYQTFELDPALKIKLEPEPAEQNTGMYNWDIQVKYQSGIEIFNYQHKKDNVGAVTFKIYKFSNPGLVEKRSLPAGAMLVKEETVNFREGETWDDLYLKIFRPPVGYEQGFYITSSETNFERGVVVSFNHQKDDISPSGSIYGTYNLDRYKPDADTEGRFYFCGPGEVNGELFTVGSSSN